MGKAPPHIRLRETRIRLGLSESRLAEKLDCSQSFVSNVERGLQIPGLRIAMAIKKLVGINPSDWVSAK